MTDYITGDEAATDYLASLGHTMAVNTLRSHLRQGTGPARDSFNGRNRYATTELRAWAQKGVKLKSSRGRKPLAAVVTTAKMLLNDVSFPAVSVQDRAIAAAACAAVMQGDAR